MPTRVTAALGTGALAVAAAFIPAAQASAATDDSFGVNTGPATSCDHYGSAAFIDSGEYGDDYVGVYDACADGVGVKVWVWKNGNLVGAQRNGEGFNHEVYFDPFNISKGDKVGLKVCAQNGPNGTPFACGSRTVTMHDG